jgi:hypothetical protein
MEAMAKRSGGKKVQREGWGGYQPPRAGRRPWEDPQWSPSKPPLVRDEAGRALVRLMPEYTVDLPLWGQHWQALDLEPSLLSALADWQRQFDAHFIPSKGWTDAVVRDEWAAVAQDLSRRLRRALPEDVDLDVNLWPLTAD